MVIVALPQKAIATFKRDLLEGALPPHVPVVDTGNYVPSLRDPHIERTRAHGAIESRWVETHLGHPVSEGIQLDHRASLAHTSGRPGGDPNRIALPVAGDDATAKTMVLKLDRRSRLRRGSTPAAWTTPGGNNQEPRSTPPTSTPTTPARPSRKPRPSTPSNGALGWWQQRRAAARSFRDRCTANVAGRLHPDGRLAQSSGSLRLSA